MYALIGKQLFTEGLHFRQRMCRVIQERMYVVTRKVEIEAKAAHAADENVNKGYAWG